MAAKIRFKSKALQFAYDRYIGDDPALAAAFEAELSEAKIASQICNLRKRAGLSQRQLAEKVGTTASVICRLEDSDYDGHSLSMVKRIAAALGRRVRIVLVPAPTAEEARKVRHALQQIREGGTTRWSRVKDELGL